MKRIVVLLASLVLCASLSAQSGLTLNINPDAKSSGMGDISIPLTDGAFTVFQNTAATALASKSIAAGYSFTSWQPKFTSGNMHTVAAYYKLNENHAISAGFRSFLFGKQNENNGQDPADNPFRPTETAIDLGYAYAITYNLAVGINARYFNAKLTPDTNANAFAGDLGVYYRTRKINAAVSLSNVGTSLEFDDAPNKNNLPAWLKAGGSYTYRFGESSTITGALQAAYMFLPSTNAGIEGSIGAEYLYNNMFAVRAGYHYANIERTGPSYTTIGCGINFMMLSLNFAYAIANADNPMNNTLRLSLEARF